MTDTNLADLDIALRIYTEQLALVTFEIGTINTPESGIRFMASAFWDGDKIDGRKSHCVFADTLSDALHELTAYLGQRNTFAANVVLAMGRAA